MTGLASGLGSSYASLGLGSRTSLYGMDDKVILDIGSLHIKAGISGESKPRHVIPTTIPIHLPATTENIRVGSKPVELFGLELAVGTLRREALTLLLLNVYNRYLLINPTHRGVVVCEGTFMPLLLKKEVVEILLYGLKVPRVTFMSSGLVALMTTGKTSGLVIDIGNLEASVLPIYDGRALHPFSTTLPIAGKAISTRLKTLLKNHAQIITETHPTPHPIPTHTLDSLQLNDLKSRLLHIGPHPTRVSSTLATSPVLPVSPTGVGEGYFTWDSEGSETVIRIGPTERLVIPGWVRERAGEVLFEGDEEGDSVASVALDCIMKCPTDVRGELIMNILMVGGTASIPGLRRRVGEHMKELILDSPKYFPIRRAASKIRFLDSVFAPNCVSWIGASLMASVKAKGDEVDIETYEMSGVPDWTSPNWRSQSSELDAERKTRRTG